MIDDERSVQKAGRAMRLDGERLALSRARAALAAGQLAEAEPLLAELMESRPAIAARARIQLARLRHRLGDDAEVAALLSETRLLIDKQQSSCRERLEAQADPVGKSIAPELRAEMVANREAVLELGRAWLLLGHRGEAREAYFGLLRESAAIDLRTPAAQHVSALAEYRLAELLVDDEPGEAYEYWRRALESGDEQVSPYAALRMATRVGGKLVTGRVERLFHHAMGSSDPRLSAEAALGLAGHLQDKRQFSEARRYLKMVAESEGDPARAEEATTRLEDLRRVEDMARLTPPGAVRGAWVKDKQDRDGRSVIIVGAGTGGDYLLESVEGSKRYDVLGFVDDNARECPPYGRGAAGYPILGRIDELARIIDEHEPDEVLLAIPTLGGMRRRDVVKACRATSTPLLNLPRMHDLGIGWTLKDRHRLMTQLREVEVEELIGEERVEIDVPATAWLQYEPVVVVGAGALGAELCRRLADGDVGKLVVIDRRKSALRKIAGELRDSREFHGLEALAGDAADAGWLTSILRERSPVVVFNTTGHSAAPACDSSRPIQVSDGGRAVVRNEIMVAAAVADAAARARVPRVLHVSSRHAGVSREPFDAMKALSEEIVLWHAQTHPAEVQAVVRVGQLLDSRNGKLARLKQQIRMGAKVTIPGPGASVRFLSTARWAELVLHAARLASNGDLLEPDAGENAQIKDLAELAIKLRGWQPGEHVLIEESGNEHWGDPLSPEPRRAIDNFPGLYRLDRAPANDETLRDAFKTCAALVHEYRDDRWEEAEESRSDGFAEIAASAPDLVRYSEDWSVRSDL